jgi:lipoprotein-anchoring transpeptidase ErfK/SrfK
VRIKGIVAGLAAVAAVATCSSSANASAPRVIATADTARVVRMSTPDPKTATRTAPTTPAATRPPATVAEPTTTARTPSTITVESRAATAMTPGVPCSVVARACVDLSAREAWLVNNGTVVHGPVPIMPGRPGWRTPVGTFRVRFKAAHFYSTEFKAPMPYSVFFYRGDAFHAGSLSVYSHGCVHLSWAAAVRFFDTLQVGDVVQVVP